MKFENQKMLETLFNERQTPLLLRKEFTSSPKIVELIQASELDEEFCLDLLGHMALVKRATLPQLIGLLKKHFKSQFNPWQATADALLKAAEKDLVDWSPKDQRFILRYDLDEAGHKLIRQYQYLPPMIVPPLEVKDNRGGGYLTIRTDSLLLKGNHHEGDICLDSINRFNRISLRINTDVVKGIRNSWKNLDKPKADESWEEYQLRVKAFERYERDAIGTIAWMVELGNEFYLIHKVDKRGRTYAQGYHINYQGNTWNKACVELANPEPVRS